MVDLPIVARLRQDRLLNPDYPTRLEAADLIEALVEALEDASSALDDFDYPTNHLNEVLNRARGESVSIEGGM